MVLAIVQARMSSTRLPGKVLKPILGRPMLERQIERLRRARSLTRLLVATSTDASDDPVVALCDELGVESHRGPLDDVLGRFHGALEACGRPATFLRLTADCPLADPALIDLAVDSHGASGADYTYTSADQTYPKGLDVEVVATTALVAAWRETRDPYDREHVTPFIYRRPGRFRLNALRRDPPERWRWTVDTPEDFAFVTAVYEALHPADPAFTSADVLAWQRANPGRAIPNVTP